MALATGDALRCIFFRVSTTLVFNTELTLNSEEFRKRRAKWNCFSKIDILGQFDFYTLSISLDSLKPYDVDGLLLADADSREQLSMADYERLKKVLPLAAHEFTHYLDGTATIWGLEHLCQLNDAALVPKDNESEFYRLKSIYDRVRRLRMPAYYSTVEKDVGAGRPWSLHMTGGREFTSEGRLSDKPIIFGRFFNEQNAAIVRSPISVISLFETSAMAEEINMRISLAFRLGEEREIEQKFISDDALSYIFNPNLTEYSVCSHLVANTTGCTDIYAGFQMSSYISRFVLNATQGIFDAARRSIKSWVKIMGVEESGAEATMLRHALKNGNHGALFYMLVMGLPKIPNGSPVDFGMGFQRSLRILDISIRDAEAEASREASRLASKLEGSPLLSLRLAGQAAIENFRRIGPAGTRRMKGLNLPAAFLGDLSLHQFQPQQNTLSALNPEAGFEELVALQIRAENLAEACI